MRDVWSSVTDISTHFSHDSNVFIAVQKRILFILDTSSSAVDGLVRLQARIGQDDDQALGVFVIRGNRHVLLCDKLRKRRRWK